MMSTAILMVTGVEQSSKQPVVHDDEHTERATFAQVLDARVEVSPAALGKDSVIGVQAESTNVTAEPIAKNIIDVPESALSTKVKVHSGQTQQPVNRSNEIASGKTEPSGNVIVASPKLEDNTENTEAQVAEPPLNVDDVAPIGSGSQAVSGTNLGTDDLMSQKQQVDLHLSEMSILHAPVIQKETSVTDSRKEVASAKKVLTKTQEGDVTQSVAGKSAAATVHVIADDLKSAQGVFLQPIPIGGPAITSVTTSNALSVANDKNGADSRTVSVTGVSFAGTPKVAGSVGTKSLVHGTKASGVDPESEPVASGDSAALPTKSDAKTERVQTIVVGAGSDTDIKGGRTSEPATTIVHAPVPVADAPAGVATPFAAGFAKLPAGEGDAHPIVSSNLLNEQDVSGGVARSTESMPRMLSATPATLEVGIPDGTHGWLKVRAEMTDGGVVNASVSAASSASQEMLHRELPSLTAYLQSEKVAVNTVVVHPAASVGAESRGYAAGTERGEAGQTPQKNNEGGDQRQDSANGAANGVEGYSDLQAGGEEGTSLLAYPVGRSWLSVRA